jgi:hypothetical protein
MAVKVKVKVKTELEVINNKMGMLCYAVIIKLSEQHIYFASTSFFALSPGPTCTPCHAQLRFPL